MSDLHRKANRLAGETSPYLLQHAYNPVNWYPWCEEAFEKARKEDKPIFLSIGYSTCHWCHVMAHESFEDEETAAILNERFVSIKVDKEERPDIDSIYMSVCQALTGSGGWPTSIFMTPEQHPFFAGTYFPKKSGYGTVSFTELLLNISEKWKTEKESLIQSGKRIAEILSRPAKDQTAEKMTASMELIAQGAELLKQSYDPIHGGFGSAPKFPTPHNLLFLLQYYSKTGDRDALSMVEKTLAQMYKGGLFDQIGFGFSRYSTDRYFLVPHFEKMLYDNALLLMSYASTYAVTEKAIYRDAATKTAEYVMRELTAPQGGFYCAQDADSDGVEGKYYVFEEQEIKKLLGEKVGEAFCHYYDITQKGNFEGKSIPNVLQQGVLTDHFEQYFPQLYDYRRKRAALHLDDKILTSWNGLMIAALAWLYQVVEDEAYLNAAENACVFIENNMAHGDTLSVSYRAGKSAGNGFLDDYAFYIFAMLSMYDTTFDNKYLQRAVELNEKAIREFYDRENGGFFLYGRENEQLIARPKETYDGAIPSGNSVMAYNLVKLARTVKDMRLEELARQQIDFVAADAAKYPAGYCFYLLALFLFLSPSKEIVCVLGDLSEKAELIRSLPADAFIRVLDKETEEYKLINGKTTFYVCENKSCKPPVNSLEEVL